MKYSSFIIIAIFCLPVMLLSQTTGDYRTIAGVTATWQGSSTWQQFNGSSWVNVGTSPTSAANTITIQSGCSITLAGNVSTTNLVVAGSLDASTYSIYPSLSSTITISGTFITANVYGLTNSTPSSINFNDDVIDAPSGTYTGWATFIINNSPTFVLTGSTIQYNASTSQIVTPMPNYNNLTISGSRSSGTVTLSSGTFGISGALNLTATSVSYIVSGTTINFNGASQTIPVFNYNNLSLASATGTTFANATISITGTFTPSSITSSSQGTIAFTGSGQSIPAFNYYNLDLSGATGALFTSGASVGIANTFTPGSSMSNLETITFNGASQTIPIYGFYNLTIAGTGTKTLAGNIAASHALSVTSTLDAGSYTINTGNAASVTISGTFLTSNLNGFTASTIIKDFTDNVSDVGSAAVSSSASINTVNSPTINLTGSTINFYGSSNQPISALSYSSLTINNASGVTMSGNASVSGTLTLTSGKITLGTYNLTMGSAAALSPSTPTSTSYIDASGTGLLVRNAVSSSATIFPIGTSTSYTPLIFTSTTSSPNISVSVKGSITNSLLQSSQVVNVEWAIKGSVSSTSNITYQYNSGDKGVSYTSSGAILGTYTSGYSESALGTVSGSNPYTAIKSSQTLTTSTSLYSIGNPGAFALSAPTFGTFSAINKNYGDAAFSISAPSSNSAGAITYTSSNTSVATISGSTITIVAVGTSTITANQAANGIYTAGSTTATLTVSAIAPTFGTFSAINKNYGDAAFSISAPSSNSAGSITYTSSNTAVATIIGSTITIVGAGTSTITANQAANGNYTTGTTTATLTVNAIAPSLGTFSDINKYNGDAPFGITAPSSNSSGAFSYTSSNTSVATISGSTITIVGVGTSTITANQAANGNYTSVSTSATLTVISSAPTISLANINKNFGDANFAVSATSNSAGAITYTSSNTSVATISGNTVTIVGVGTTTITVNQAANGNYVSGSTTATLTVSATVPDAPVTASAADDNGQSIITYTAPINNGGAAITSYTISATPSFSGSVRTGITANPYTFTGLTNGTTYTFTVAAHNSVGTGAAITTNASTPSSTTTWNGTSWSATAPDASQSAVIAANLNINNTFTSCAGLTINAGVTLTLTTSITVNGAFINNGTITGTGTLTLGGVSNQTVSGTGVVGNITINNASGVTVSSGANSLGVSGVLTLQSGVLTTNGNVTLKSLTIANSGILAPYGNSGNTGTISGNVTVERYIPKGYRAYRDISAGGVYKAGNTLFNTWQESGAYTHGYGMFITGILDTIIKHNSVDATTGIDHSLSGYASAYYYKAGWDTVKNTKTELLNPYQSYRVLIRGDRSFDLDTTPVVAIAGPNVLSMNSATALRASGSLITGTVTYTTSGVANAVTGSAFNNSTYGLNSAANSYTYIANPYPCPIDFHHIYLSHATQLVNMKPVYYYLDPTIGSTGAWVTYNAASNISSNNANYGQFIQAGQGFLVGDTTGAPQVVITEADKSILSTSKTSVFGNINGNSKLGLSLLKQNGDAAQKMDGAVAVFGAQFSNAIGIEDAAKMSNASDNLSISEFGHNLSIDGRLPATVSDVLAISLSALSGTSYKLVIDATDYSSNSFSPYLFDAYKNTTSALLNGSNSIDFTVDNNMAASYQNRFSIVFKPAVLPVKSINLATVQNKDAVAVSWSTNGESNVAYFIVEKSDNASSFVEIGRQNSKNSTTASYLFTDSTVLTNTSFYRIKAVSTNGSFVYSNVSVVVVNSMVAGFNLFPNPLIGKTIHLQMNHINAGKYAVVVHNNLGQKVTVQSLNHQNGNETLDINLVNNLSSGVYTVSIIADADEHIVYQSKLLVK